MQNSIVRDLRTYICGESGHEDLVKSTYVACFCETDNVLSQWRCYGNAGGYTIGFPAKDGHIPGVTPESPSYTSELTKVNYPKRDQIKECKDILNMVLQFLDDPTKKAAILSGTAHTYQDGVIPLYDFILRIAQEMLVDGILSFKDQAFEEEREWRLIARPRQFLLQGRDDRGKTPNRFYFRPSRGVLVPYIKLIPLKDKVPITSIRSGPSVDLSRAETSVRMLMSENGFPEIAFSGSAIPVLM